MALIGLKSLKFKNTIYIFLKKYGYRQLSDGMQESDSKSSSDSDSYKFLSKTSPVYSAIF